MNLIASDRSPPSALTEAGHALRRNELWKAETLIRAHLALAPDDFEAARLLAGVVATMGSFAEAEALLRRVIERAPAFVLAYADLASLLCRLNRAEEGIALLDNAIEDPDRHLWALSLKANILTTERRVEEALHVHEQLVVRASEAAVPWINYAHALKTVGRLEDAVAAYRRSLAIDRSNGFAWWGLANLRTVRLGSHDVILLEQALKEASDDLQRVHLHFALGKALGDLSQFELSFHHYQKANDIRGRLVPYKAIDGFVRDAEAIFTAELFAKSDNVGMDGSEAIFIVGMPRSGSTLVEQILASHPMVEGLGELFELQNIVTQISHADPRTTWPKIVARFSAHELRALGQSYLSSTRRYRRTDRPFFTDKMPSNWQYIGLLRMILPNAKIIDVRRDPVACCFSNFTTYFNLQTSVPNSLAALARHYRSYVRLVSYFDAIQPGRNHLVQLERLIENTEVEVSQMLAYLELPFETNCLHFHENPRIIDTPSSEQVRTPINRDGISRWRNYEPWIAPLQDDLGSIGEPNLRFASLSRSGNPDERSS
ncbi:sulfotransferase [Sphingobium sp. CR28]|uniref:sulfotransferase n=1 Tax=Sphingobium sp. CR28 TaxID=3400272 RepID=UPI003FF0C973